MLALVVGVVGGIYGIGGGSLLAPILIALGFSVYEVAPATFAATFVTSIVGIATYQVLQLSQGGAIAPEWVLGAFSAQGGSRGSYPSHSCDNLGRWSPQQPTRTLTVTARVHTVIPTQGRTVTCDSCGDQSSSLSSMSTITSTTASTVIRMG